MEKLTEVWIEVPETNGRYMVSNKGHLRQIARKERHGQQMLTIFTSIPKRLVSDFKTEALGWHVFIDGEKRFWERAELINEFEGIPVVIDATEDNEAIELRKRTFRNDIGGGREAVRTETPTVARKASDTAFYREPAASAVLAQ